MCYFALLAEAFKQKFLSPRPPPAFSFIPFFFFSPSPTDSLQHLQSHPSLRVWPLVLGRGSLQKDRVALWGVMQPREALPYPAPHGFPCSGHCQGTERDKFYYCSRDPWRNITFLSLLQQSC